MPNPLNRLPMVLTMGDPAGIGPEIIAGAMIERPDLMAKEVVVAGDVRVLRRARRAGGESRGAGIARMAGADRTGLLATSGWAVGRGAGV